MRASRIGWTDYSGGDLNVVTGCTPISAGCAHCYGRAIYERFGRDFSQVTTHPDKLARLAKMHFGIPIQDRSGNVEWYSPKRGAPHKPMAFIADTGDLFHERVPEAFVARVFALMLRRPHVTWQVLTKRPERMRDVLGNSRLFWTLVGSWNDQLGGGPIVWPADYIWLGVSVEDQRTADERIPILLDTPAAVRFVSVEPCLAPVDLRQYLLSCVDCGNDGSDNYVDLEHSLCRACVKSWKPSPAALDWVICGAESGPNRRPFDVAWAADLRDQCREAGLAFYGKQTSGLRPGVPLLLDGVTVHEWPREA